VFNSGLITLNQASSRTLSSLPGDHLPIAFAVNSASFAIRMTIRVRRPVADERLWRAPSSKSLKPKHLKTGFNTLRAVRALRLSYAREVSYAKGVLHSDRDHSGAVYDVHAGVRGERAWPGTSGASWPRECHARAVDALDTCDDDDQEVDAHERRIDRHVFGRKNHDYGHDDRHTADSPDLADRAEDRVAPATRAADHGDVADQSQNR
jgi:hypothetical protein